MECSKTCSTCKYYVRLMFHAYKNCTYPWTFEMITDADEEACDNYEEKQ